MRETIRILVILVVGLCAGRAGAENLLLNPYFDVNVNDWSIGSQEFIVFEWADDDANGSPSSGSLEVFTAVTGSVYQCVPVVAGEDYEIAGAIKELSSEVGTIGFSVQIDWNDGADCLGNPVGTTVELTPPATQDVWHDVGGSVTVPNMAVSAFYRMETTWTTGLGRARFDNVYLPEVSEGISAVSAFATLAAMSTLHGRASRRS